MEDYKYIQEMRKLFDEITALKTTKVMLKLENNDLKNEIKELKQKLNALHGKEEK